MGLAQVPQPSLIVYLQSLRSHLLCEAYLYPRGKLSASIRYTKHRMLSFRTASSFWCAVIVFQQYCIINQAAVYAALSLSLCLLMHPLQGFLNVTVTLLRKKHR